MLNKQDESRSTNHSPLAWPFELVSYFHKSDMKQTPLCVLCDWLISNSSSKDDDERWMSKDSHYARNTERGSKKGLTVNTSSVLLYHDECELVVFKYLKTLYFNWLSSGLLNDTAKLFKAFCVGCAWCFSVLAPCNRTTGVLDSGFQPSGFWIPTIWIPDSDRLDSGFQPSGSLDSKFQYPWFFSRVLHFQLPFSS